MSKKQILILTACVILCSTGLLMLYSFSPLSKEMYRASFSRKFVPNILSDQKSMDIEFNSFYFVGIDENNVYLGNSTAPFHLLISNRQITDTLHTNIELVDIDSVSKPRSFRLAVDSPYFYLSQGTMPIFMRGNVGEWKASKILSDSSHYFTQSIPIGPKSFVLRSYSLQEQQLDLGKKSANGFRFNFDLLQKQIDGMFCVDGQMEFNKKMNRLIYLYNYRNEFIVTDTNLNLLYRGHTIDTFSHAHINVAKIGDPNRSMLSAPPMNLFYKCYSAGNYLFILSNLLAKNEDKEKFLESSVIDVYEIISGKYLGTFYIKNIYNDRIRDFIVDQDQLYTISDKYLTSYMIDLSEFEKMAIN